MLAMLITRSDSLLNCEPAQWGRWREWRLIWGRDEPHQDQKAQPVKETMHDLNSKVGKKGGGGYKDAFNIGPPAPYFPDQAALPSVQPGCNNIGTTTMT